MSQLAGLGVKPEDPKTLFDLPSDKVAGVPGVAINDFTLLIKGSRVKEISSNASASYVIVNAATSEIWMIAPPQKRYIEWNQADRELLQQRLNDMEKKQEAKIATLSGEEKEKAQKQLDLQRAAAKALPEYTDLKKQEKVAGLEASVFDLMLPGRSARAWIAKDPTDLASTFREVYSVRAKMQGGAGLQQRDLKELVSERGIPARLITFQAPGFKIDELVAVEPGKIEDQAMALPADYEKVSLQDFFKAALQDQLSKAVQSGQLRSGGAGGAPAAQSAPAPAAPAPAPAK